MDWKAWQPILEKNLTALTDAMKKVKTLRKEVDEAKAEISALLKMNDAAALASAKSDFNRAQKELDAAVASEKKARQVYDQGKRDSDKALAAERKKNGVGHMPDSYGRVDD